jgi:hypothetical protein
MPYTPFDATKPDAASQNGTQFAQSARDNLKAIRDAALMGGGFFGWPLAISGGTAEQPTTFIYSSGTERVLAVITWGTTGGATGNPQTVVYSYSSNSGGAYDTIGTKTITYDANSNVTATSWS